MNKFMKFSFLLVFAFFTVPVFADNGPRIYNNEGKFSFCPPLNWTEREFPGLKYKLVAGPTESNFTVNISLLDDTYNGTLQEYVNGNVTQLSTHGYTIVNRKTFRTNSGISGECVTTNSTQNGFFLKQVFYFLPASNDNYFVITCSALDRYSAKYLSAFEDSIKTFELTNTQNAPRIAQSLPGNIKGIREGIEIPVPNVGTTVTFDGGDGSYTVVRISRPAEGASTKATILTFTEFDGEETFSGKVTGFNKARGYITLEKDGKTYTVAAKDYPDTQQALDYIYPMTLMVPGTEFAGPTKYQGSAKKCEFPQIIRINQRSFA
jgi:hypothetical protein